MYVAETGAVGRVRFDAQAGATSGAFERLVKDIPAGGGHWTRTLRFGADGWMYVSIGSSCNVCAEKDPRRAAIVRYHPDGTGEEIYATGLRNAVGFDWRPADGQLYATDNGRDLLGDDFPPCELDRVVQGFLRFMRPQEIAFKPLEPVDNLLHGASVHTLKGTHQRVPGVAQPRAETCLVLCLIHRPLL